MVYVDISLINNIGTECHIFLLQLNQMFNFMLIYLICVMPCYEEKFMYLCILLLSVFIIEQTCNVGNPLVLLFSYFYLQFYCTYFYHSSVHLIAKIVYRCSIALSCSLKCHINHIKTGCTHTLIFN